MDLHNALRRYGSLINGVRRMVGGGADVQLERLGETLTPIMNPWGLPEWAWLRGETLWVVHRNVGAVVGEVSGAAVVNPTGSNMIVVVDGATFRGATAQSCTLSLQLRATIAATYTQGANAIARDSRTALRSPANFSLNVPPEVWTGSDAAVFTNALEIMNAGGTVGTGDLRSPPYVLRPGVGLAICGNAANIAVDVCMFGRARSALPGELE